MGVPARKNPRERAFTSPLSFAPPFLHTQRYATNEYSALQGKTPWKYAHQRRAQVGSSLSYPETLRITTMGPLGPRSLKKMWKRPGRPLNGPRRGPTVSAAKAMGAFLVPLLSLPLSLLLTVSRRDGALSLPGLSPADLLLHMGRRRSSARAAAPASHDYPQRSIWAFWSRPE